MKPTAIRGDESIEGEAHVALFDILGFKELVRTRSTADLRSIFQEGKLLQKMASMSALLGSSQHYVSRFRPAPCEFTQFSDTILVVSPDRTERGLVSILTAACSLVAFGLMEGIPLRGAVTRGELFVSADRRFHAGEAIVRAHELEGRQEWVGGIVDERCIPSKPRFMTTEVAIKLMSIEYEVPVKRGEPSSRCLNWAPYYAMSRPRDIEESLTLHVGGGGDAEVRKRLNTTVFYNWALNSWLDRGGRLVPPDPSE